MFDAKSLLEQLVRGGGQQPQAQQAQGGGGLADILGQLGQAMGQQPRSQAPQVAPGAATPAGNTPAGLEDLLRNMLPGGSTQSASGGNANTGGAPAPGGGLGDILGRLNESLGNAKPGAGQGQDRQNDAGGGGGLMDILGQVLGQATQGVREGAGRIDQATGASGHMKDLTGKSPDDLMAQLKDLIAKNQLGAGAIAGGLGGLLLGTESGRSIAGSAIQIGGLALIGGLAYKALQNYQQGRPLINRGGGAASSQNLVDEAPHGSGFESHAVTQDSAILYIRGMIAAAAADGRIDEAEQDKVIGGLKQAGLDAGAEEFLAGELNNPATVEELAQSVRSEAEAVQLFAAARIAIDLDTVEEHDFLVSLATALGLDANLVAHIDAEARAAAS